MARITEVNRDKCKNDPMMPAFSDKITHVCLTRTHWTHAAKLAKEGYRTISNTGKTKIHWKTDEAQMIFSRGIMVIEYMEKLWDDEQAMMHFMAADNLNASVGLSQDEMTMYGKVERLVQGSARSEPNNPNCDPRRVLDLIILEGQKDFSNDQILHLINFRATLNDKVSNLFRACLFHLFGGQVRVNTTDFALVATLDIRCPWMKICVMLQHFAVTMKQVGGIKPSDTAHAYFSGRHVLQAKRLAANPLAQLKQEVEVLLRFEKFVKQMLKHYAVDQHGPGDGGKVLMARSRFLCDVGTHAMKVGKALDEAAQKSSDQLAGPVRVRVVAETNKDICGTIEAKFAKRLLDGGAFTEASLPKKMYQGAARHDQAAPSQPANVPTASGHGARFDEHGDAVLAPEDVKARLGINGIPALVCLRRLPAPEVKVEEDHEGDARGTNDENQIMIVNLLSLQLPAAAVEYDNGKQKTRIIVKADSLLPYKKKEEQKTQQLDLVEMPREAHSQQLPPFDYECYGTSYLWTLGTVVQQWAHVATYQFVQQVQVTLLSEPGKMPYLLQAHVREGAHFGKGELFLSPYGGDLKLPSDLEPGTFLPDDEVFHEALPASAAVTVWGHGAIKKRRVAAADARDSLPELQFMMGSPLFRGKQQTHRNNCYVNLAPYWAVSRCGRAQSRRHSMVYDSKVFEVPHPKVVGGKGPTSTKTWKVKLPVLTNVKKLAPGDLLCLPFFDEAEE